MILKGDIILTIVLLHGDTQINLQIIMMVWKDRYLYLFSMRFVLLKKKVDENKRHVVPLHLILHFVYTPLLLNSNSLDTVEHQTLRQQGNNHCVNFQEVMHQ